MCCSGDSTAKAAEQQQAQFSQQLMNIFQQQYGAQSAITSFLTNTLEPQIQNPQGYDATTLADMKTNATDTISNQYQNAEKALQNQQFVNGGENLPSGVNDMANGAMKMGQASDTASALQNIDVQNQNLKQQNYWNAVGALSGNASLINPTGYSTAANQSGSTTASLSNAVTSSQAAGWSPFSSLLGAGASMGAAALYGKSSGASGSFFI